MPFGDLSPVWSVYPIWPLQLLSSSITMSCFMNNVALTESTTGAAYTGFSNFYLKLALYQNESLHGFLRGKRLNAAFMDYYLNSIRGHTRVDDMVVHVD